MPALLVDTSARPASSSNASTASDPARKRSGSVSPDRPPVSPITPTATVAQLAPIQRAEAPPRAASPPTATFIKQPPSVAISESDNPDAIALRSAISLLQLQREKSKRDLVALEELKAAAVADPHGFVRSLQEQRAQAARAHDGVLAPTLSDLSDLSHLSDLPAHNQPPPAHNQPPSAHNQLPPAHNQPPPTHGQSPHARHSNDARKDSASVEAPPLPAKFPAMPQPQNIVRCPPINWAKYHIVGEPLDKMHEEQRKWPGAAEPPKLQSGTRAPPHTVAAPYSPFTDGIAKSPSASQPAKSSKKSPSRS